MEVTVTRPRSRFKEGCIDDDGTIVEDQLIFTSSLHEKNCSPSVSDISNQFEETTMGLPALFQMISESNSEILEGDHYFINIIIDLPDVKGGLNDDTVDDLTGLIVPERPENRTVVVDGPSSSRFSPLIAEVVQTDQ
jgi:hypothetical protein